MKDYKKRLSLLVLLMLTSLAVSSQNKLTLEFGSNVLGYKSQYQEQDLYLRTMYELPTNYIGHWQLGFGSKYSKVQNMEDNEDIVEFIFYSGYTWEDVITKGLDMSFNGSFNLNSFSLLFVTSLGLQFQTLYEISKGVSVFMNLDNASHIERDSLYPNSLNRRLLKQNISIYGGIKVDLFDARI